MMLRYTYPADDRDGDRTYMTFTKCLARPGPPTGIVYSDTGCKGIEKRPGNAGHEVIEYRESGGSPLA